MFFSRRRRTGASEAAPTANVITASGELRRYAGAVRAADVLSGDSRSFLCNADDVELDGYLTAVEELLPGELYFAVPRAMLRRRLRAEEVGALAVKAGAALAMAGVVLELAGGERRGSGGGRRVKGFSPRLAAIPELMGGEEERKTRKGSRRRDDSWCLSVVS